MEYDPNQSTFTFGLPKRHVLLAADPNEGGSPVGGDEPPPAVPIGFIDRDAGRFPQRSTGLIT